MTTHIAISVVLACIIAASIIELRRYYDLNRFWRRGYREGRAHLPADDDIIAAGLHGTPHDYERVKAYLQGRRAGWNNSVTEILATTRTKERADA